MIATKKPAQTRAKKTKQSIIDAAFKLFLRNGYKKTNTIIIAQEANVSVGIVYSYFHDKNELFELWLNSLLERCDTYFYNQFKLKEYDVELSLIISNILEKTTDTFFKSPLIKEKGNRYLEKTLNNFFDKVKQLFIKSCYENEIFIRNHTETSQVIFQLIKAYNEDVKSLDEKGNMEILKNKYIQAIISLLV